MKIAENPVNQVDKHTSPDVLIDHECGSIQLLLSQSNGAPVRNYTSSASFGDLSGAPEWLQHLVQRLLSFLSFFFFLLYTVLREGSNNTTGIAAVQSD